MKREGPGPAGGRGRSVVESSSRTRDRERKGDRSTMSSSLTDVAREPIHTTAVVPHCVDPRSARRLWEQSEPL